MARARLEPGTWGKIRTYEPNDRRKRWLAVTQYCDERGKKRQREATGRNEKEAIRNLKDRLSDETEEQAGQEITPQTRIGVIAEDMFGEKRARVAAGQLSPTTLENYETRWNKYLKDAWEDLAIEWATVRRCDTYFKTLRQTHSYSVVRSVRTVLSEILAVAVRYDALEANPVEKIADIPGAHAKPAEALDPGQAVDLWQTLCELSRTPSEEVNNRRYRPTLVDPDVPDVVLWMLGTSDRIGNALAVHWTWIDLENGTARLGPNVIRVRGKGLVLNEGTTKTRDAEVDLPEPVIAMLLARWEKAANPIGPVFPDSLGGLKDPSNFNGKVLRRALDLAGYDWVTSHVFRKTVATVLDDSGLSARHVADQLRHARPSMTQDRYMRRGARNPRAKAALEAMFATAPEKKVVGLRRTSS